MAAKYPAYVVTTLHLLSVNRLDTCDPSIAIKYEITHDGEKLFLILPPSRVCSADPSGITLRLEDQTSNDIATIKAFISHLLVRAVDDVAAA